MLPTFVIGLREGLEAALIVGIVAAFLRQRGRLDLLRWAFAGVGAAIGLCLAIGIALDVVSHELPQRQQEGLETVIGACAVAMVTYMVVWMRRHSRTLKAQLEGAADHALAAGSGFALVLMAFLAVLREGLETVVFLLAAFNQSGNTGLAAAGAVLGIIVAVILGWGIYRGGVRLNLSKFFRLTGIVLTFVAAGLVVSALHTAHEAGWLTLGQQSTVDLSALVRPGSVQAALLTGMLGVQPHPVLIEVIGWLVYLVPALLYVAIPPSPNRRRLSNTTARRLLGAVGALGLIAAILLAVFMPGRPVRHPATRTADGISARLVSTSATGAVIAASVVHPGSPASTGSSTAAGQTLTAQRQGQSNAGGAVADLYTVTVTGLTAGGPSSLTFADLSERNGGRLPLGVRVTDASQSVPVREQYSDVGTFWVDPTTGRVVDIEWHQTTTLIAQLTIGPSPIGTPATATWQLPEATALSATRAAHDDRLAVRHRSLLGALAVTALLIAALCAVVIAGLALTSRRRPTPTPAPTVTPEPVPAATVQPNTPQSALVKS